MKKKSDSKITYAPFEIADYLDNEEVIAEYLSAAAQEKDSDILLRALSDVAKARGMAQVAKDAGLGRESLYKALSGEGNPSFATILKVMGALGVELHVKPHADVHPTTA